MLKQYTETFSNAQSDITNIVANDCALLEDYILCQTGQNEWSALIRSRWNNNTRKLTFARNTGQYQNNTYVVTRSDYNGEFGADISNEYYIYSNCGYGKSLELPIHQTTVSYSLTIITCFILFAVVFKGVLFKCLKRKR